MDVDIYINEGKAFGRREVVYAHLMIRDQAQEVDGAVIAVTETFAGVMVNVQIADSNLEIFKRHVGSCLRPFGRDLTEICPGAPAFEVLPIAPPGPRG